MPTHGLVRRRGVWQRSLAAGAVLGVSSIFEELPTPCCHATGGTCGVRPVDDQTTTNPRRGEVSRLRQSRWRIRSRTRISDEPRSRPSSGPTAW